MVISKSSRLYIPYSASKLKCFEQCPKLFEFQYVKKIKVKKEPVVWFEKGKFLHWVMEHYPVIPEQGFQFKLADKKLQEEWTEVAKKAVSNKENKYLLKNRIKSEIHFAMDDDFNPISHEIWPRTWMGYIDHFGKDYQDRFIIVDWKTGKSIVNDDTQLKLYALWIFQASPQINEIITRFSYLDLNEIEEYFYSREDVKEIKSFFINKIDIIENCTVFQKQPSQNCTYCDYFDRCRPFKLNLKLNRMKEST